jgi:rSAM/selenodomain-associated transferase 2
VSIVIPVLNEVSLVRDSLASVGERAPEAEIVVVDGNSTDGTSELAARFCHRFLTTAPNRARQMNAGAAVAHGEVLWFLHIDAEIPPVSLAAIERALQDRHVAGGFFRIQLPRENMVYRLTDSFAHYAGLLLRMRCGDHGLFCRREVFERIGGFPEIDLMEDVEFFRKLRRAGRVVVVPARINVSPRRYEKVGPIRLTLGFGLIAILYFFHAPMRWLESIYRHVCCREVACPPARSASY